MRSLHRFRVAGIAIGAVTGLALAAGVYAVTANLQTEESKGEPAQNPCYGLSDSECHALITDSEKQFEARLAAWLAEFNSKDIDLRALPTAPLNATYGPTYTDLDSAIGAADVIVLGVAKSVKFEPQWASVTLLVEQALKGSPAAEITIRQGGGPEPYPDWDSVVLGIAEADPLLFPGDRALLFLNYGDLEKTYEVQPVSGHYRLDAHSKVAPLELNPFAVSLDGLALEDFLTTIEAIVVEQ
jgi:hypothetical protein